jgi:hypothetical protein
VILLVFGSLLLVCLGMLSGATWATQLNHGQLRRQAEERRRLNDEWAAIRAIRRQQDECPTCASPLYEPSWHLGPRGIEERPDDGYVVGHRIN